MCRYTVVPWSPSVGPTKKVTQSRTCHRPRRVSRYGATLTPHSHGGPEVSGGRQGDPAAGPHARGVYRIYTAALFTNCVLSLCLKHLSVPCAARPVLPWSIIQVARLLSDPSKALKSQEKPGDKFERNLHRRDN